MHREQAVSLLAEFIFRKVTEKGAIAQALRVLGNVPCDRCIELRRENTELRRELFGDHPQTYKGPTPVAKPVKTISQMMQAEPPKPTKAREPLKNQPPQPEPGE